MSFEDAHTRERGPSVFSLFEFQIGEDVFYRYTDADEPVWFQENEFIPEPISRSDIETDGTLKKANIKVNTRYNLKPAKIFRVDPPSFVTNLKVWEGHFTDRAREFRLVWSGRVLNCKAEPPTAEFTCEPISTSLKRPGLRRNYQRPCPHALYGTLCGAAKVDQPVNWVSGSDNAWVITKPSSGYIGAETYEGGLVSWIDAEGLLRRQTILSVQEDGNHLILSVNRALAPSQAPTGITIRKGCNHTEDACSLWHDNIQNFGGCPFIPTDTPINKFSTYY